MSKTLGLALGSGGARGVAHVGVLLALEEAGIKPDYITGCSMGAVIGGGYASGMTAREIADAVLKIRKRDLIDINPAMLTQVSLLRSKKLRDYLASHVKKKNIEDFEIPFKCVATDVLTGTLHVFESGDAAKAIQASSSVPAVFKPVKHEGKLLVDGGCLCRLPIRQVKEMGADVVVAVDALAICREPVDEVKSIVNMVLRVYDIIEQRNTDFTYERDKEVCDLLLTPEIPGMSQYLIKDLDRAFIEGYEVGKANVDKIKELLK